MPGDLNNTSYGNQSIPNYVTATQDINLDLITVTEAINLDNVALQSDIAKLDWITVTQAVDLDALEATVAGLSGSGDSAKLALITVTQAVDLDALETTVNTTHEAEITALQGTVSTLTTTTGTNTTNIATNTGDIANLESDVSTLQSDVAAAESDILAIQGKTNWITVTQAVNLDTIESNSQTALSYATASKTVTDFITVTAPIDLDDVPTAADISKLDLITVTSPIDLDAIPDSADISKLDFITVTQNVNLDTIESDLAGVKTKTDWITVGQAVNLDTIETDVAASKTKTNFITVTQAVNLDTIESDVADLNTKTDFITVTQAVNLDTIETHVGNLQTLSGVAAGATSLGTFTGTTIVDSSTIKVALQAIETAHETTDGLVQTAQADIENLEAGVGALQTLSGVPAEDLNLGTFTGTLIPDSATTKSALQALETPLEASKTKTDYLTVTAATDLNDIRTKTASHNLRLISDHTNAETDLGLVPNSTTSRTTLTQDPGSVTRAANTTALHTYFNNINTAPSVHKVLYFPTGSFAVNKLNPSSYQAAFKNFTMTGVRPEYAAQHIETGSGNPEWGSRIDYYNTSDTDYFIDIPGSNSDKSIRPATVVIKDLVFSSGDMYEGLTNNDYTSMKGGCIRIGDRSLTGVGAPQYTQDLARGVFLQGCYFTDLRVSKSNPTYQYLPQQSDGFHTIYTNGMGLVEMNRVYDLTVDKCAFRGGLGPQLWLTTCDRPLVYASRHFLAYIALQNACTHSNPADGDYYRDFMDADGVPGTFHGIYVEQPAVAGILAAGGMYSDMRIEGGYQDSYPNDYGPGYYPLPTNITWAINFSNLAGASPTALNEEQYIQFAGTFPTIIPYVGASSRTATIADYIQPGMVLKLEPTSPSTYGYKQRPTTHLLVTAVDATNNRVYWYGGYRASNQTGIGVAMLGKPTSGGTPIEVMSGNGSNCTRIIGIPFVGAGSRIGLHNNSLQINATPGSDNALQPLPIPRMALSFDRTVFTVSGTIGNNGAHMAEEDRDAFRALICTTNWGGAQHNGACVAYQGQLPPESPHAKVFASGELEDWPRSYEDRTDCDIDNFDYFTSVEHQYILGNNDWMLQFHPVYCPNTGKTVFCYDTSTNFWQAFANLPADSYHYTLRFYSPKQIGSQNATNITESSAIGDNPGKCLFTFATAHNFAVDQVVDVGNTGVGGYNVAHTVLEVPSPTTMVTSIDYISNVTATINVTIQNADRLAINYRTGSGDGVGTTVLYPPTGVDFTQVEEGWNTIRGAFPAGTTDVYIYNGAKKLYLIGWMGLEAKSSEVEVVTASKTVTDAVFLKKSIEIDSSAGAVTVTVPDGWHTGQKMTITMTDATNASSAVVTHHQAGDGHTLTFNALDEAAVLEWTSTEWVTIYKSIGV